MKKLITCILLCLTATGVWSQDDDMIVRDPKAQEKIKAARIAFITERLELTPAEAEKFWPVYREFASKRTELRQQFEQTRKNPQANIPQEQVERELVELNLKLKQQELDLEKEYSRKMLNVIPAQKLMALKLAEDDFRRLLIQQIQQRQLQQQRREQIQNRNEQRLRQRNN
ncbi:MAG: hypothetical protein MUE95_10995 [Cyclobacteriaceae bacterium]|nr:hypothetical protein [Cyclobacteriaceae bacterium]